MIDDDRLGIGKAARQLVRAAALGSLATVMRKTEGSPYASLVAVATDHDGAPILLISDLADHTKNLKEDDRVSLLLTETDEREDPLAGERLSLQGRLVRSDAPSLRQRYLARHPSASLYADFADFGFYLMTIERGHLVAGFGPHSLDRGRCLTIAPSEALAAAETDIIAHMNEDHADTLELYATRLLDQTGGALAHDRRRWRRRRSSPWGTRTQASFRAPGEDSTDVRKELITLVNKARDA